MGRNGNTRMYDGAPRHQNKPSRITDRSLLARWLEREVLRQKKLGISFGAIADLLTRTARGEIGTGVVLPELATLPRDYSVTGMGCYRALKRALEREPAEGAAEFRNVDTQRLEDWLLNMAPRLRTGDTDAIRTGVRVLRHKADINNYGRTEGNGSAVAVGFNITINMAPPDNWRMEED